MKYKRQLIYPLLRSADLCKDPAASGGDGRSAAANTDASQPITKNLPHLKNQQRLSDSVSDSPLLIEWSVIDYSRPFSFL